MASITSEPNGHKTIQFVNKARKRKSIRVGKCSQRQAEALKERIEALNAAQISGQAVDSETSRWLTTRVDVKLAEKLAKVGLIAPRQVATLGAFLTSYVESRADVKPGTKTNYGQVERDLVAFFGANKPLAEISHGDADAFRLHLLTKKGEGGRTLGENTVRRRCGRAKQFFRAAVRKKLIAENPFGDMKAVSVRANRGRDHFISRNDAAKVLEACPDSQWRLLFALSRYGGLRCPSEHLALRWGDIDWAGSRMTVRSPKTEHNEGGESRIVPIFPELRPYLDAAYEEAEERTEFVITKYRDANANLRTQLNRIITRAGLTPWPKLFQNLRATRETELAANYPLHVVCKWIGNSQTVARKHYLQVTETDFDKAGGKSAAESGAVETDSGTKTVHNPAQQHAEELSTTTPNNKNAPINRGVVRARAAAYGDTQESRMTPTGLEPVLPP